MVDHVNDKDLSEFILAGTHHCCSVPFQAPPDDLTGIKCADIHKSYARPQDCRFYEECKFPNKITRFSPTNCVEGPGLYLIKNIDWSQATTKFNDSKTRVGPRRAASGRAWNWLMSPVSGGCRLHLSLSLSLTLTLSDKSVTKGSLSRWSLTCRAVAALHAPGLIATSQLSNPRTQQVAPRARIA